MSQAAIARALGLSPALVCRYRKRGMPVDDPEAARAWHRANILPKVRATTAPRPPQPEPAATGERLDLAQERALLIRAQRREVEIRLRLAAKTYAPIEYLTATLATASAAFVEHCDHIPARLRREHPGLPAAAMDAVLKTLADARNAFCDAAEELQLPMRGDYEADDETTDED